MGDRKDGEKLVSLKDSLEKLNRETPVGDDQKWDTGASTIKRTHISDHNNLIDADYKWERASTIKTEFLHKVDQNIAVSKGEFQKNIEEVRRLIKFRLGKFQCPDKTCNVRLIRTLYVI